MDNPQEWTPPLPLLPDDWQEQIAAELEDARLQLEKAKTLEEVLNLQGEIKAYRTILGAKEAFRKQQKIDAEIKARKAEDDAERERRRNTAGWKRFRFGSPKHGDAGI